MREVNRASIDTVDAAFDKLWGEQIAGSENMKRQFRLEFVSVLAIGIWSAIISAAAPAADRSPNSTDSRNSVREGRVTIKSLPADAKVAPRWFAYFDRVTNRRRGNDNQPNRL